MDMHERDCYCKSCHQKFRFFREPNLDNMCERCWEVRNAPSERKQQARGLACCQRCAQALAPKLIDDVTGFCGTCMKEVARAWARQVQTKKDRAQTCTQPQDLDNGDPCVPPPSNRQALLTQYLPPTQVQHCSQRHHTEDVDHPCPAVKFSTSFPPPVISIPSVGHKRSRCILSDDEDTDNSMSAFIVEDKPPKRIVKRLRTEEESDGDGDIESSPDLLAPPQRKPSNVQPIATQVSRKLSSELLHPPMSSFREFKLLEKIVCELISGRIEFVKQDVSSGVSIGVAEEWLKDKELGTLPSEGGGYIGSGCHKMGIAGIFRGRKVAIFQLKPKDNSIDEETNFKNLRNEMFALAVGDVLLEQFNARAKEINVNIARISWNFEGAFIGKVQIDKSEYKEDPSNVLASPNSESSSPPDNDHGFAKGAESTNDGKPTVVDASNTGGAITTSLPLLIFQHFLVVPFLQIDYDNHRYIRFHSRKNSAEEGLVYDTVQAYAHFTYTETGNKFALDDLQGVMQPDGSCILIDPQYHSMQGSSWDGSGKAWLDYFARSHSCTVICKRFRLPPLPKPPLASAAQ